MYNVVVKKVLFLLFLILLPRVVLGYTDKELTFVGERIYANECGKKPSLLVVWNKGEDFISLGIGHFIWYPKSKTGRFTESFPDLLVFIEENGKVLPIWLENMRINGYSWRNRKDFIADINSITIKRLRSFLLHTMDLQVKFIFKRFDETLDKIIEASPQKSRDNIKFQFNRVKESSLGMYTLVDYVNFKGEGINLSERYNGKGWGLLQVLGKMHGRQVGKSAIEEFVTSAKEILSQRITNAPKSEERWRDIWNKRLESYLQ